MTDHNPNQSMWSLQVKVGKCSINLKTEGTYAVSLKFNKFLSNISKFKNVDSNSNIQFNTTLKLNVQKQFIEDNQNCIIILHFQKQSNSGKDKKIIGMASFSVLKQNNNGFKFFNFGQCADSQAQIEIAVNYYEHPLQIQNQQSNLIPSYSSNSQFYDLQRSRGVQSSIQHFKDQQTDFTKEQKAYSHIGSNERNYKKGKSQNHLISKYYSRIKEAKQQGDPDEIITVLQSQIDQLNGSLQELKEREEKVNYWKKDMKEIILQLQAENQLLKQIKIEELHEYNIQNFQEGIKLISKFVRQKFQTSKLQHKSISLIQDSKKNKSMSKTKSWTELPKFQQNQTEQKTSLQQKEDKGQKKIQSWKKQLKMPDKKIQQLEQEVFKVSKQRNELYQISEELYKELKECKQERDKYLNQIREVQLLNNENVEAVQLKESIESIKQQNQMLKFELQSYLTLDSSTQIRKLTQQNKKLIIQLKQLERKIMQSFKAIEQFKNDALKARQQIVDKDQELQNCRITISKLNRNTQSLKLQNKQNELLDMKTNESSKLKINMPNNINAFSKIQVDIYTSLLQNSLQQRRNIFQYLKTTLKAEPEKDKPQNESNSKAKLNQLQTQINKLFVQIFKEQKRNQNKNSSKILQSKKIVSSLLSSLCAS